jgi:hypothetical protein
VGVPCTLLSQIIYLKPLDLFGGILKAYLLKFENEYQQSDVK